MDAQRNAIGQNCLKIAYDRTMAFPDLVGTLTDSGFEGYTVDSLFRPPTRTSSGFLVGGDQT